MLHAANACPASRAAATGPQRFSTPDTRPSEGRVQQHIRRRDAEDMPAPPPQCRNKCEDEPHRSKIIHRDRTGHVVETIERIEQGSADRLAGVADQDVDPAGCKVARQCLDHRSVDQIRGDRGGAPPRRLDLGNKRSKRVLRSGNQDHIRTGGAEAQRDGATDAEACAGDHDALAGNAASQPFRAERCRRKQEALKDGSARRRHDRLLYSSA
ncbi:hypothetical protein FHS96_004812 [Sphingomonas zeicaulis]